jgi:hypothetical protein
MPDSHDWRPDPRYQASSFQMAFCDDLKCGLHIVAYDDDGQPMAEIVMSPDQTLGLVRICQDHLYEKAVLDKGGK